MISFCSRLGIMKMMLFVLVGLIVLVRSASVTPSAMVPLSSEFQKFLEAEINDDSVPTGFKQICSAICNNELHVVQAILDSDEFWKDYPDDMLIVPEDIATAKLLLISHMEGKLEICKIILGCPRFTVPISMPLNCPELALIVACRNEGNEDFLLEYLEENKVLIDVVDKCIGLAQYHEDYLYLQIFFRSEVNIRYDDLPCQIRMV